MNAPRIVSLAVALILTPSADVLAQQEPLVASGAKVRVSAPDFELIGTAAGFKPDTLLVDVESPFAPLALPLASVTRLEIRRGRRWNIGRGAFIGFVSGAVLGAATAIGCQESESAEWDPCATTGGRIFAGALITAAGTVVGTLVGAVIWTDRWEAVPLDRIRIGLTPHNALTVSVLLRL